MGSSETIRDNISDILYCSSEFSSNRASHNKLISQHVPTKIKPLNNKQLGYYLAGLIDGDVHFDNQKGHLIIVYDIKDKSVAYWLKNQIGYGSINIIKNKNAIKYVISHSKGLFKILELINGKLKTHNKYDQIINNLLKNNILVNKYFYNKYNKFIMGDLYDFNNHWLTGFIDADGSFQIKILERSNRKLPEIRLKLQITQKDKYILNYIKLFICKSNRPPVHCTGGPSHINDINNLKGCYIGTRINNNNISQPGAMHQVGEKDLNLYYYLETTSLNNNKFIINYLDKYHLISYKYLNYLYFRKTYLLIQNKDNLTNEDINKIKNYKNKMRYKISEI